MIICYAGPVIFHRIWLNMTPILMPLHFIHGWNVNSNGLIWSKARAGMMIFCGKAWWRMFNLIPIVYTKWINCIEIEKLCVRKNAGNEFKCEPMQKAFHKFTQIQYFIAWCFCLADKWIYVKPQMQYLFVFWITH